MFEERIYFFFRKEATLPDEILHFRWNEEFGWFFLSLCIVMARYSEIFQEVT